MEWQQIKTVCQTSEEALGYFVRFFSATCASVSYQRKLKCSAYTPHISNFQLLIYISKLRHNLLQVLLQIEKRGSGGVSRGNLRDASSKLNLKRRLFFWCFSLLLIKNNINFVCHCSDVNFPRYGLESFLFRLCDFWAISLSQCSWLTVVSNFSALETKRTKTRESSSRMLNLTGKSEIFNCQFLSRFETRKKVFSQSFRFDVRRV